MNDTEIGYHAIRNTTAFAEEPELRCLQVTGENAFELLDDIFPCDLFLLDGQMRHTLLLNNDGTPFADVYVCRQAEDAYILGYGPKTEDIIKWINEHVHNINDTNIINLNKSHANLALDGPYAWELCADVFTPDILGLPYLGMFTLDQMLVFRAGRTGEYGYHILVPFHEKEMWIESINSKGKAFHIAHADKTSRDQCVLENFFFDISREGQFGLTPLELQLQWRLSRQKYEYPGAKAIAKLRNSGWTQRLTCFTTPHAVNPNAEITFEAEPVGRVLATGYSPTRDDYVGKALIRKPYWHAGLDAFQVDNIPLKTISAPAINNLSLKISPYHHSFHTRNENII